MTSDLLRTVNKYILSHIFRDVQNFGPGCYCLTLFFIHKQQLGIMLITRRISVKMHSQSLAIFFKSLFLPQVQCENA